MLGTAVEPWLRRGLVKRWEQVIDRRDRQLSRRCPDLILLVVHVRVELTFLIHKVGVRWEWFHISPHIHRVAVRVGRRSPQHVRVSQCAEATHAWTRIAARHISALAVERLTVEKAAWAGGKHGLLREHRAVMVRWGVGLDLLGLHLRNGRWLLGRCCCCLGFLKLTLFSLSLLS